jgi:hypothetical protein
MKARRGYLKERDEQGMYSVVGETSALVVSLEWLPSNKSEKGMKNKSKEQRRAKKE